MSTKHTAGPWQVKPNGCVVGANGGTLVTDSMRAKWESTFAAAGWSNDSPQKTRVLAEVDANARLIAAAPDYAEAAALLFRKLFARAETDYSAWHRMSAADIGEILNAFRRSIAKARGES